MVLRTRGGKCILCHLNLGGSAFKELRDYLGIPKVLSFNFLGGGGSLVLSGLVIMVPIVCQYPVRYDVYRFMEVGPLLPPSPTAPSS